MLTYADAVGVAGAARALVSECWLRRQTYAAFWVGVDAGASELVVRRCCIKGLLFQDWCFIAPNETARQLHRYPDKLLPACEMSGQPHIEGMLTYADVC